MKNLSIEWARENRHTDVLASFIFNFYPQNTEHFPNKQTDWLQMLEEVLSVQESNLAKKYQPEQESVVDEISDEEKISSAIRMHYQKHNKKQISKALGVSDRTVRRWLKDVPDVQTLDEEGKMLLTKEDAEKYGVIQKCVGITEKDVAY